MSFAESERRVSRHYCLGSSLTDQFGRYWLPHLSTSPDESGIVDKVGMVGLDGTNLCKTAKGLMMFLLKAFQAFLTKFPVRIQDLGNRKINKLLLSPFFLNFFCLPLYPCPMFHKSNGT